MAHPPRINKQRYEIAPSEKVGACTEAPTVRDEKLSVINAIPSNGPSLLKGESRFKLPALTTEGYYILMAGVNADFVLIDTICSPTPADLFRTAAYCLLQIVGVK